jgi:hypothetical protein
MLLSRNIDDFPSPRWLVPSGVMDQLPDGAQFRPGMNAIRFPRPSMPADCKTAGQRKQWVRDCMVLKARQEGMSLREIAEAMDMPLTSVCRALKRCRERLRQLGGEST